MEPPRLRIIKEIAERLGLDTLAEIEMSLVHQRPVPPRLIASLVTERDVPLSERERDILALLASGYRRQEIADELGIGLETVKGHLRITYRKLGVRNQIEAVNSYLGRA